MAVRCQMPVALRDLANSVDASAAYIRAIEETGRRGAAGDGDAAPGDLEIADLLERTARELRRASVSLLHVYGAYTEAACSLATAAICRRPGAVENSPGEKPAAPDVPDRRSSRGSA
jgi:hypothetical protein